jgi:hypothetical protein
MHDISIDLALRGQGRTLDSTQEVIREHRSALADPSKLDPTKVEGYERAVSELDRLYVSARTEHGAGSLIGAWDRARLTTAIEKVDAAAARAKLTSVDSSVRTGLGTKADRLPNDRPRAWALGGAK